MFFITIKCDKDLVNAFGHKEFTKGKEYLAEGHEITERTAVVSDDEGCRHTLGMWYKHFKIVK